MILAGSATSTTPFDSKAVSDWPVKSDLANVSSLPHDITLWRFALVAQHYILTDHSQTSSPLAPMF